MPASMGGTEKWLKKKSENDPILCQMYVISWFILTLCMVATKRRMAAATWKRMMKAKIINMVALLFG